MDAPTGTPRGLVLSTLAAFVACTLFALFASELLQLGPLVRLAVAGAAVVTLGFFLVAVVRLVRSLDELHRRVQLEALAIAYPTTLLLLFAVGQLERQGFTVWGFERLRDVWPLAVVPYFVGVALAWRRYR